MLIYAIEKTLLNAGRKTLLYTDIHSQRKISRRFLNLTKRIVILILVRINLHKIELYLCFYYVYFMLSNQRSIISFRTNIEYTQYVVTLIRFVIHF